MSKIHLHTHGPGHGHHHDDEEPPAEDSGGHTKKSPWPGRLELIITIALGLAAITGAFAAYKNEERDHSATAQFSLGIRNYDDAGQFYATGNAVFTRDQSQFLAFATAVHNNQNDLANYISGQLMDPTLQNGIKWWESTANTHSAHPARTPFTDLNPDYGVPQLVEAANSTTTSQHNFAAAKRDQDKADHFTIIEVILATALFLYGIAGVTRNMTLKIGALISGLGIFFVSLGLLIGG
jgi:hypothetical protein